MIMGLFKRTPDPAQVSAKSNAATAPLSAHQQQLLQLNVDFLKLLVVGCQHGAESSTVTRNQLSLPTVQAVTLAACSDDALRAMSACGFSLFTFNFHQADTWERLANNASQQTSVQKYSSESSEAATPASSVEAAYAGFAECALFFAWHMAQEQLTNDARVMLGMREETAAVLAPLELWQCRQIAQRNYQMLTPRWPHNPYFWVDLLRYGDKREEQHFKFSRLMGTQLIAKDLEPSALFRVSPPEKS